MNLGVNLTIINQLLLRSRSLRRIVICVSKCARYNASPVRQKSQDARLLPYEVNTAVPKDVLLFKYENDRFFRILNFFAISQFIFWTYLSEFAYSSLKDVSKEEAERRIRANLPPEVAATQELAWWRRLNLGENKYRNGITLLCLTLGSSIAVIISMVTRRTVKQLTLLQGGQQVRLVCYSPWWLPSRTIVAPVDHFSCQSSRAHVNVSLPVRIKGYRMFFLLDKSGVFTNTKLFDVTAGLKRTWR